MCDFTWIYEKMLDNKKPDSYSWQVSRYWQKYYRLEETKKTQQIHAMWDPKVYPVDFSEKSGIRSIIDRVLDQCQFQG